MVWHDRVLRGRRGGRRRTPRRRIAGVAFSIGIDPGTRAPTVVQTVTSAPKAMPHVQLEAVVIRPLAQQLAELERIRQAGVASATANATASLAATTAAPRAAAVVGF